MKRWKDSIIYEARELRKQGYSYGQLTERFNVAKSTLHHWLKGDESIRKFTKEDLIKHALSIQPLAVSANKRKREKYFAVIHEEVLAEIRSLSYSLPNQKAILSILYWAEGSKGSSSAVRFANTDPRLALLFVSLLRQCYQLDETKFRVRLHLHYYHKAKESKKFWSELLGIPQSQFTKIYWKPRSKTRRFRQNYQGICFVGYNSTRLKDQIMAYALSVADWNSAYTHP